jgi:hypothetical protein
MFNNQRDSMGLLLVLIFTFGARLLREQHEPKIHFCKWNLQKLVEAVPAENERLRKKIK